MTFLVGKDGTVVGWRQYLLTYRRLRQRPEKNKVTGRTNRNERN